MEEAVCPVCATGLPAAPRVCPRCATPHHQDCWAYVGDCAVFGCAPGAPRLPADPRELDRARRLLTAWHWCFRLQWWAFLALTLPILALAGLGFVSPLLFGVLGYAAGMFFELVGMAALVLVPLGGVSWLVLALPALALRLALEARLGQPLAVPGNATRTLAERLEPNSLARRLREAIPAGARSYALGVVVAWTLYVAFLGLTQTRPGAEGLGILFAVGLAVAGFFALVALGVARVGTDRAVYLASIQNRLVASTKQARLPAR